MRRFVYILIIAILVLASTACAFDGKRKGFVLGGGLGYAPVVKWSLDGHNSSFSIVRIRRSRQFDDRIRLG